MGVLSMDAGVQSYENCCKISYPGSTVSKIQEVRQTEKKSYMATSPYLGGCISTGYICYLKHLR